MHVPYPPASPYPFGYTSFQFRDGAMSSSLACSLGGQSGFGHFMCTRRRAAAIIMIMSELSGRRVIDWMEV